MRKKNMKKVEKRIPIPLDRYMYFRDALRAATEARRELMEHLQTLIERETQRHQEKWDEIAVLAGFSNTGEMHSQQKEIVLDWRTQTIVVRDRVAP